MILMVHEILEKAAAAKTREEKIKILQKNNSLPLRDILRLNFDESVTVILPEGTPPYEPFSTGGGFRNETRRLAYFCKGGPGTNLLSAKRERMFIEILQKVHPKEAELLCAAKDRTLKYKGITKKLVSEAFPNLITR